MRTADQAPPVLAPAIDVSQPPSVYYVHGDRPEDRWAGVEIFVCIEYTPADYHWAVWDRAVWDVGLWSPHEEVFTDFTCEARGFHVSQSMGRPVDSVQATQATFELANRGGFFSQFGDDGRLMHFLPGHEVLIWYTHLDVPWMQFRGEITSWRDVVSTLGDPHIEAEAFDETNRVNQSGATYEPGAHGETPGQRLTRLAAIGGYDGPIAFAAGNVTLNNRPTTNSPLEEMKLTAGSDGGLLVFDGDGTWRYFARSWADGRPDQPSAPVLLDDLNIDGDAYWGADPITGDDHLSNVVRLENLSEPTTGRPGSPIMVEAFDEESVAQYGGEILARQGQLWLTRPEGQALADHLVAFLSRPWPSYDEVAFYVDHPAFDLWPVVKDLRIGDLVRITRRLPSGEAIVTSNVVTGRTQDCPAGGLAVFRYTTAPALNPEGARRGIDA